MFVSFKELEILVTVHHDECLLYFNFDNFGF